MLAIVGGDTDSWGHLALFLQACSLLQLRSLTLRSNYILFNESTTFIMDIPGSLFNVVSIRLWGVYFCWDRCYTFKFLKISCIHEIKAEFGPDWSAWEAMADAALGMEKLSLRWKDCNHLPAGGRLITFPISPIWTSSLSETRCSAASYLSSVHPSW
ncbi:hypothetical protein DFH09DRAFT_1076848 [Mycena vulgaris]|nr:hypothetical protein DFH09DRAFT_1076848 [Mycena vulgaris]